MSAGSVQTLLLVLSADTLPVKYTGDVCLSPSLPVCPSVCVYLCSLFPALVDLAGTGSGSISRSGLRSLLDHLNQVWDLLCLSALAATAPSFANW